MDTGTGAAPETVRATLLGAWPGADPVVAARDMVSGLGSPHLPVLPELPARGPGSDAVGRSAGLLEELAVDLQPHGWRLVPEPGMDHRRAVSALSTDRHALTDIAGEAGLELDDLALRVRGPMSLAADLWLTGGERSLSDYGARRDVAQSLTAGLAAQVRSMRAQTGASRLTVIVDEPRAAAILSGTLPTASGYRTVRSIPRTEVRAAWTALAQAVIDAGASSVVLAPGRSGAGEAWPWTDLALLASESLPSASSPSSPSASGPVPEPMSALALPLVPLEGPGSDASCWDIVAGWTEAGRHIVFRLPEPGPAGDRDHRPYRDTAVGIARTWERIGLDPARLAQLVLAAPDQSGATRLTANRTLEATVAAAEQLDRIRQDGGLA
ncbi:hypothetical protein [Citricoccus sp. GCM10030269]|uniref:hypothetical protein n=1 Tax=Citricoccus sp. GCM10030269 TaxID=3273388 RepID=UPI003615F1E0